MKRQLEMSMATSDNDLREEIQLTKEKMTNLRRGLFGRYDKLVNELTALQDSVAKIQEQLGNHSHCERIDDLFGLESVPAVG